MLFTILLAVVAIIVGANVYQKEIEDSLVYKEHVKPTWDQYGSPYWQKYGSPYWEEYGSPYWEKYGSPFCKIYIVQPWNAYGDPAWQDFKIFCKDKTTHLVELIKGYPISNENNDKDVKKPVEVDKKSKNNS